MAINTQVTEQLNAENGSLKLTVDWTSDGSGDVSEAISPGNMSDIKGKKMAYFTTNPGATAPTADYDLTLLDTDGLDVLGGNGADRSATLTQNGVAVPGDRFMDVALTFVIDAAGITKDGVAVFYFMD